MKTAGRLPRALRDDLVIRELDDETLIYDTARDQAHCLNIAAARVWKFCDGKTTAAQASRTLQAELDPAIDSDFVWLAVKQLQKFHLVERGTSPSVSRRDLVFKYGPAAVALLPIIYSISAPEPASAASCGVNGDPCPCCTGFSCFGSPPTCHPS